MVKMILSNDLPKYSLALIDWIDSIVNIINYIYINRAGLNKTHIINIPVEERKTESKSQQWNAKINDDDDDSTL